jgi:propionyl-CoA synthetase
MMKALLRRPPLRALPSSTLRFRRQCSSTQGSYSTTKEDYESMAANALKDPETFWLDAAKRITWVQPPTTALDSSRAPMYQWFPDGVLNTCFNALDRHLEHRASQTAIAYHSAVGGRSRSISYAELHSDVERFSGALSSFGVQPGDRVLIYMPMVPEALVAMLACARLGAVHSVVFGGFAPKELAVRITDAEPTAIVTSSCGIEKGTMLPYLPILDAALEISSHAPRHVAVHQRTEAPESLEELSPRDTATTQWHDFYESLHAARPHGCVPVKASDPLYLLYTSGSTGKPKGVVRDNTHAVALQWTMDHFMGVQPGETYWAASDIGWVVGHSYICYAPLLHGCTTVLYEGKPVGTPDAAEYWRVIEKHKVAAMFTAPTALRAIRKVDAETKMAKGHDLRSLRCVFVAGERCDPDTLDHFRCALNVPVIDNWWQTETGSPIAGFVPVEVGTKSGSTALPLPGFDVRCLSAATGEELPHGTLGSLAARLPLPPGTMQTLHRDEARFVEAYRSEFEGYHSLGDAGTIDDDGYISVMARTDDVINVAGHRLSTGLLEEVVASHPAVAECAVVGARDPLKGQVPVGLVVLRDDAAEAGVLDPSDVITDVVGKVRAEVGAVAAFRQAAVVEGLPKTRSGKTLRGIIQSLADGTPYTLPGTIEDAAAVDKVKAALRTIDYPREAS